MAVGSDPLLAIGATRPTGRSLSARKSGYSTRWVRGAAVHAVATSVDRCGAPAVVRSHPVGSGFSPAAA